MKTIDFNFN